jgi:hypothetical protein
LNSKIEALHTSIAQQQNEDRSEELSSMSNLRECVQSAADVVSTTSSTLTVDMVDRTSVRHGSDFGDVFVKDTNEAMLRWMSSNTVYEFEDMVPHTDPSEASTGDAVTEYQSDSDSDLETEMVRALFKSAITLKEVGDLHGAERKLRNCLTRLPTTASTASFNSLKSAAASGVSRLEILELLLDTCCMLKSWSKAQQVMTEKLSITEKQVGRKDELYLWDTLKLAEFMAKSNEYDAAHLQGRRSLRGFKRLGEGGYSGYEQCVVFLIALCNKENLDDEEEAYAALLVSHQAKVKAKSSSLPPNSVHSTPLSLQPKDNQEIVPAIGLQNSSGGTESLDHTLETSENRHEEELDQQVTIKDGVRSLRPNDSLTLPRYHFAISPSETISKSNSPTILANDNTSFAQDVYDNSLRRSVSDTQLVHEASISMALPSTLAKAFTCEVLPDIGEHRRSVSDGQCSLIQSGSLLALADEQAPFSSAPSTRDVSDSQSSRASAMKIQNPSVTECMR